ncbi:MAG: DNA-binding response regulator [Bacteroidetes bacterium]|nr:MAG: DNA-binding response regulator [Bacteroidota bacterium]
MENFNKIKAIIIDDEKNSRELIFDIIKFHFPNLIIETAENVAGGIEKINKFKPNIVFLDIDMPDGTGFDVLKNLTNYDFKVIFITGHEEHAIKAIKFSALDYILKPVNAIELVNAIKLALKLIKENYEQIKIETLLNNLNQFKNKPEKLILNTSDNIYIIDTKDIIRCQSDNNYTVFYLVNSEKIVMSKTLKEYENILPEDIFIRVHRSHLININFISRITKRNSGFIRLKDDTEIPFSPKKKDLLLSMIKSQK